MASGNSVLDSLQLDMARTASDSAESHHDTAQSSSGQAGLASNYSNSTHTKPATDVHLIAPKGTILLFLQRL